MKPSTDAARLRESAAESGIVASLAASPLCRERAATAFDLATMLDAEELAAFIRRWTNELGLLNLWEECKP